MSDYAVKITIRNGRILKRMRQCGFDSVAALARAMGHSRQQTLIGQIINLKIPAINKDGEWRSIVMNMAGALSCNPEDMFSEAQATMALEHNSRETFMDEPAVRALASGDMESSAWARIEAQKLLECLTPREREVMESLLHGETFEDVGKEMKPYTLSRERIRQIEAKAIRKMRGAAKRNDKTFAEYMVYGEVNGA